MRWFVAWLVFLLFVTGIGAAAGYTSGIYVRSTQTFYLHWGGAWRVGLEFAAIVVVLTIASYVLMVLVMWARGER